MAASSGQTQDTAAPAKDNSQQKKLFIALAVLGVLIVGGGGYYFFMMPKGSSSAANVTNTPAEGASANTASLTGIPGAGGPIGSDISTTTTVDGSTGGAAVGGLKGAPSPADDGNPLSTPRDDPFQQAYLFPTPVPTPVPPVDIPLPDTGQPVFLPNSSIKFSEVNQPLNLPPVQITRLDENARRPIDAFPPRRTNSDSGENNITPSTDKRLSGVVVGDGVRALLEISGPNGVVTRNVQPGDEVDGITILNIQRIKQGAETITRMTIRENGEEKSVDLRPSPNPPATAGGFGSEGGLQGGLPGAFPGALPGAAPGISPSPSGRGGGRGLGRVTG